MTGHRHLKLDLFIICQRASPMFMIMVIRAIHRFPMKKEQPDLAAPFECFLPPNELIVLRVDR
jgi:hypothetical protein